jgi:adenylyltransferase/sulfurtransferase
VVGCGGLGAPCATSLAAAGVGQLTLVDDDVVEASNLNRQTWFTTDDLGQPKVEVAAAALSRLAPEMQVSGVRERLVVGRVRSIVRPFDLVLDCTDGLPTKFMLNDACVRENRPLVHGSATAWAGEVLFVPGAKGPCLRCLFESPPPAASMPTCRSAGVLGAVTGVIGHWMALEALQALLGVHPGPGRFVAFELLGSSVRTLSFKRNVACGACGDAPRFDATRESDYQDGDQCDDT